VLLDPCWAHLGLCGPTLGQYGCPSDGISGHRVIDGVGGIGRKAFTILRCAMTGCALWLARRCCCCCCCGWLRADTAKGCCCMRLSWCYACRGCLGCPACCLGWQVWPACCVVWPACCIAPAHFFRVAPCNAHLRNTGDAPTSDLVRPCPAKSPYLKTPSAICPDTLFRIWTDRGRGFQIRAFRFSKTPESKI
jgi:hypothetical protein